jgi:YD repeat-containing protein
MSNHPCLKLIEGDVSYQYDNRGRLIEKSNLNGTIVSYQYVGDTIIMKHPEYAVQNGFGLPGMVTEKALLDYRGFINSIVSVTLSSGEYYNQVRDTFIYNNAAYLIFSGNNTSSYKYVYDKGNLTEFWGFNNLRDSSLLYKYEYDLLNENKEAAWIEWIEHKGKSNKNLIRKEIDFTVSPEWVREYSYKLNQGYPIQAVTHVISPRTTYDYTCITKWSCLR